MPAAVAVAASLSTPAPGASAGMRGRRRVNFAVASLRRAASGGGSSWRSERRLMSELERTVTAGAAERVIRSYVASKSERAALAALSRLLMDSDPFAIPVRVPDFLVISCDFASRIWVDFSLQFYEAVTQARWFKWSSIHAAAVAALLESNGSAEESRSLISDSISRLESSTSEGEVALFYCDLMAAFSSRGMRDRAMDFYSQLRATPLSGAKTYTAMIKSLCLMGLAGEAEAALMEMVSHGHHPEAFQFGLVAKCYGKAGSMVEMERVISSMSDAGIRLGTGAANIVLSCYTSCRDHSRMLAWLRKMRKLRIAPTTKAYNFVLNSCPTVSSMAQELGPLLPLSTAELVKKLRSASPWPAEAELVQELLTSCSVLDKAMDWSESEVKLNLHGFSTIAAYVLILQWVDAMKARRAFPLEVSVVCGIGKHSDVRGEPKVRELAQEVLSRMGSPLRLSMRNKGRLVAKRDRVKQWLATDWSSLVDEKSTDQSPNGDNQQTFLLTLMRKLGQVLSPFLQFSKGKA
uniref:Smr domain-containing protein n=1 Tax=Oryza punctata TaxID=4537 RepID=A0A0E0JUS5_ORYPU